MEEDEMDLIENFKKINLSFKTKNKELFIDNVSLIYQQILREKNNYKEFSSVMKEKDETNLKKKISRSLTFHTLNNLNFDFESLHQNYSQNSFYSTCISSKNNSINSILGEPILSSNINLVDDVLKIMVIGDSKVGKTLLINKILNKKVENGYTHTYSFEIKKKVIKLLGKFIKLELWDTNNEITNSEIITSK